MKFFDVIQGSDEWHELRRGVPTSSEFDRIITPKTGKLSKGARRYIAKLIGEKLSFYGPERPESYTNSAMRHGLETEAEARNFYSLHTGSDVVNGGFCLTDDGRFGSSPDGLVGEQGTLELKCPGYEVHTSYLLDGTLPDDYKCQVHGHLAITGRQWADFLSYHPGLPPLLVRTVPDEFTTKLQNAMETFWKQFQESWSKIRSL